MAICCHNHACVLPSDECLFEIQPLSSWRWKVYLFAHVPAFAVNLLKFHFINKIRLLASFWPSGLGGGRRRLVGRLHSGLFCRTISFPICITSVAVGTINMQRVLRPHYMQVPQENAFSAPSPSESPSRPPKGRKWMDGSRLSVFCLLFSWFQLRLNWNWSVLNDRRLNESCLHNRWAISHTFFD